MHSEFKLVKRLGKEIFWWSIWSILYVLLLLEKIWSKCFYRFFLWNEILKLYIVFVQNLTNVFFFNRFNKREEAQEAISALNNVIPQGGNQPLIVRVAEEHGRAKAALYLPAYNSFNSQNRGRLRIRNQPY